MKTDSQQQPEPLAPSDDSLYRKGVKLFFGIGMERDQQQAVQCFREGYAKGDLNAGCILAECLANGNGTARDVDEFFRIAKKLVDKKFYPAYYLMAEAYLSGKGVAANTGKAQSFADAAIRHCSAPLPGVDESLRFEILLASMCNSEEIDWYAVEKVAQKHRETSDWPTRHSCLAMALLRIAEESPLAMQEFLQVVEDGCAENDVLCFFLKATEQIAREHYKEAKKTLERGLKLAPGSSLMWDCMWMIALYFNKDADKVKEELWKACALGNSAISRGNDLGVRIEIEPPLFVGSWKVQRDDSDAEESEEDDIVYLEEPVLIVKNTSDKKLEGATIRICSADVGLNKTVKLDPIPPHGEISLDSDDLGDIHYGVKLYVRVSKGDRYSEMELETMRGLDEYRLPLMPLMLTWKSGAFSGYILQLQCMEGKLSNIVVTKQSGGTAHIPSLEETQKPATLGWMEFSDGSSLTPFESFIVECDDYAPIIGVISVP